MRGRGERRLLALASKERLERILQVMLDEDEFLSEHGIRSYVTSFVCPWGMADCMRCVVCRRSTRTSRGVWTSMASATKSTTGPVTPCLACLAETPTGEVPSVRHPYSSSILLRNLTLSHPGLAVNFLLIESLQRFYQYYGDEVQVECPTGSGDYMNLANVAEEIQHRIIHIFGRDVEGKRATNGGNVKLDRDPHFRDYVWFYEVRPHIHACCRQFMLIHCLFVVLPC